VSGGFDISSIWLKKARMMENTYPTLPELENEGCGRVKRPKSGEWKNVEFAVDKILNGIRIIRGGLVPSLV